MTARQRRSARRRAIRARFPLKCVISFGIYDGEWEVYGYKGQLLRIRRFGMSFGYTASPAGARRICDPR